MPAVCSGILNSKIDMVELWLYAECRASFPPAAAMAAIGFAVGCAAAAVAENYAASWRLNVPPCLSAETLQQILSR